MSRAGMTVVTRYQGGTITGGHFFGNIYSDGHRWVVGSEVEGPKGYSMFKCSHSNIGHTTHRIQVSRRFRQFGIGRSREAESLFV
jgi:hypothetical protein